MVRTGQVELMVVAGLTEAAVRVVKAAQAAPMGLREQVVQVGLREQVELTGLAGLLEQMVLVELAALRAPRGQVERRGLAEAMGLAVQVGHQAQAVLREKVAPRELAA